MKYLKVLFTLKFFLLFNFLVCYPAFTDNHNIYDTLEIIKKDLKTLEKAVYQKSDVSNTSNSNNFDGLNEDILTKHLLKLNVIEDQFRELTNKF